MLRDQNDPIDRIVELRVRIWLKNWCLYAISCVIVTLLDVFVHVV